MTTIDVENMSAADIKAKRAELAEAIKAEPDLAARYVQARLDAKMRDDKLAEQGATITALQQGLQAATERGAALDAELAKARQQIADLDKHNEELIADRNATDANFIKVEKDRLEQMQSMKVEADRAIADLKAGADRIIAELRAANAVLAELAKARRAALADVMGHANTLAAKVAPLLAAE